VKQPDDAVIVLFDQVPKCVAFQGGKIVLTEGELRQHYEARAARRKGVAFDGDFPKVSGTQGSFLRKKLTN
jgi:hypothetical protein